VSFAVFPDLVGENMEKSRSEKGYDFEPLSYAVIGACIDVQRQLGLHCKEEDYQRALALALTKHGLNYKRESEIPVLYDGVEVTKRKVDFRIWNNHAELLLEAKARVALLPKDMEQSLLYLQRGEYRLILLVNFGEKPLCVRRFVNSPDRKIREMEEKYE